MCSILGYFNTKLSYEKVIDKNLLMSHRGPDDSTVRKFKFNSKELYLGHNRLSIQDLATHANQPMENDRFVIIFNGEIYNHFEIRKSLQFNKFRTTSDTETILWAFSEFGIEKALNQFIGMFAIAIFDKIENKLYLVRDRVGIKPLCWTYQNGEFVFASELKGFADHLKEKMNDKALVQFMSFGYIPNNSCYYDDIYKLEPAHYLIFDGEKVNIKGYWSLPTSKINISYEEAVQETEKLIRSSIKYRLIADVKVGCFLSGGIDSSLVAAIMQQESNESIKTFSIGFEDKRYDESIYAKEVAGYIKSEHHEYKFSPQDVFDLIKTYDDYFDEPFGDAASLPGFILSKMTKEKVTVALGGDGGDELFLGYDRYFFVDKYMKILGKIPIHLRSLISLVFKYSNVDKLEKMSFPINNLNTQNLYSILFCSIKPWDISGVFNEDFFYSVFEKVNIDLFDLLEYKADDDKEDLFETFSKLDFNIYLPDDILTKVDRTSMAYGLEARVPLLDHRIVELAYSLPTNIKLKNGPKSILKDILFKHVPRKMVDRPKSGFSVPLKDWFRCELKDVLYDKIEYLDERFDKNRIKKIFAEHQKGKNHEYILWNIMRL